MTFHGLAIWMNYNGTKLHEAQAAVKEQLRRITPWRVQAMSRELDPASDGPVTFVLFSSKGFDARKIDKGLDFYQFYPLLSNCSFRKGTHQYPLQLTYLLPLQG